MDIIKAKAFLYAPVDSDTMYMSKDLWELIDLCGDKRNLKYQIFGIIETESGDTLMNLDWSYSGEPIIMDRFIHLKYYLDYHWTKKLVEL